MDERERARRAFLLASSGLLGEAWLASSWPAVTAAAEEAARAGQDPAAAYQFLTAAEAADVEAISSQIVPSDALPGASEAHVTYFIDRALASFFAFQAAEFRTGLAGFQAGFRKAHPQAASFAAASSDEQIAHLQTVEHTAFFERIRQLTLLGMFSDPKYGGNHEQAGWKLLGFTDSHVFSPPFGYYDRDYPGFVPYSSRPST
jgi:gluconate 2-dehydrogenase gamma chain